MAETSVTTSPASSKLWDQKEVESKVLIFGRGGWRRGQWGGCNAESKVLVLGGVCNKILPYVSIILDKSWTSWIHKKSLFGNLLPLRQRCFTNKFTELLTTKDRKSVKLPWRHNVKLFFWPFSFFILFFYSCCLLAFLSFCHIVFLYFGHFIILSFFMFLSAT